MNFVLYRVAFCLFNALGVNERSGKWLSGLCCLFPSPRSESQLGLIKHMEPELLQAHCTPQASGTTPSPRPYFPQAPVHPQCNKVVYSVGLLPLCGPGEGQGCWGEM